MGTWLRPALVAGAAVVALVATGQGEALSGASDSLVADPRAPIAAPVLLPVAWGGPLADLAGEPVTARSATPLEPGSATPDPSGTAPIPSPSPSSTPTPSAPIPSASSDAGWLGLSDVGGPTGVPLDADAVTAELRPLLRGGALGAGRTPAQVIDVSSGEVLYAAAGNPTTPASTMKLVTATSVLDALGPDTRLRTRVLLVEQEARVPRVVIVGAGDPSLRSTGGKIGSAGSALKPSSMEKLAASTARALSLRGITKVKVGYDAALFTGPAMHPSWTSSFPGAGIVAPVSALQVDAGRSSPGAFGRVADPARRAGEVFAKQLADAGVRVRKQLTELDAPDDSATLASVLSPPVGVLVERMLAVSDNDFAEALGRLGALASGQPGSFSGVSARARELLTQLQVDHKGATFADGSGLSRRNKLMPTTLTELLRVAARGRGSLARGRGSLHSGLPVAGATGSLSGRFRGDGQEPARGVVRAKTGTLTSVVGLAGYASRPDGRLLAFAFLDDSATGGAPAARAALDSAAAALVSCDCAVLEESERTPSASP